MDNYDYRNRGAAEILKSFGLMLASGFSALSRVLYGVCGARRHHGYARQSWDDGSGCCRNRDDCGCYCNRGGGHTCEDDGYTHWPGEEWRQYGNWRGRY